MSDYGCTVPKKDPPGVLIDRHDHRITAKRTRGEPRQQTKKPTIATTSCPPHNSRHLHNNIKVFYTDPYLRLSLVEGNESGPRPTCFLEPVVVVIIVVVAVAAMAAATTTTTVDWSCGMHRLQIRPEQQQQQTQTQRQEPSRQLLPS